MLGCAYLLAALVLLTLSTCSPRVSALEQVKLGGTLRVATLNSATTYFEGAGGASGFEYELVQGLADQLGVKLEIKLARSSEEALQMAATGQVHLAAAALGVTDERRQQVRFTRPFLQVVPQLVYRRGNPKPESLDALQGRLRVPSKGLHAEWLKQVKAERHAELAWEESSNEESEALLYKVATGSLDYTIADSNLIALTQRYYPRLQVAFAIRPAQGIAWALSPQQDASLYDVTDRFLRNQANGLVAELQRRYFSAPASSDPASSLTLAQLVQTRLPPLRPYLEAAALKYGFDWTFLAAMAYQESHWDPAAVSPTGVKGIMMLTKDTAKRMGVTDREDPAQSINGGAAYFRLLLDSLPADIPEKDRIYQALAAYNMGLGHLLDVRKLARKLGRNPNRWVDIRSTLPLLTQPEWHAQTRHGYARGYEAMSYVRNIRIYHDMLVWISSGAPASAEPVEEPEVEVELPSATAEDTNPLNISSPML